MVNPDRCFTALLGPWIGLVALCAVAAGGQVSSPPTTTPIEDEQRITAVDVIVGIDDSAWRSFASSQPRLPKGLNANDFSILYDGQSVPVVASEALTRGRPEIHEPWTLVLAFDVEGSRSRTLRWAASTLSQRVEALVGLGSIEIVLLDGAADGARVVLDGSRNVDVIRERLAQIALRLEGRDALVGVRESYWRRLAAAPAAGSRLAAEGRDAEVVKVVRHQDALLAHLESVARRSGPRRAVFWATGGFDLRPEDFYGANREQPTRGLDLAAESEGFIRTLAADGWVVISVAPPPPDPLRGKGPGKRLGKWRFTGLMATYEAERDPDLAEAHLSVGRAAMQQGQHETAAEAYEKAYYHFWGDPRTQDRQAVALVGLAEALDRLERQSEARRAREMAYAIDPSALAGSSFGGHSGLLAPDEVLGQVAHATGGAVIRRLVELDPLLEELALRLRLTFQVEGQPTGALVPLATRYDGEPISRGPRWARSGPAPRWATARARLALADGARVDGGDEPGAPRALLTPVEWQGDEQLRGHVTLDLGPRPLPTTLRLTLAAARPGEAPEMTVHQWHAEAPFPGIWPIDLPTPCAAAVVWEDLDSGASGVLRLQMRP